MRSTTMLRTDDDRIMWKGKERNTRVLRRLGSWLDDRPQRLVRQIYLISSYAGVTFYSDWSINSLYQTEGTLDVEVVVYIVESFN